MALNSSLGFAKFAHREHLIHDFLSTAEPVPAPPTLQELRSLRKAKKRQLRELQSLSPEQIDFAAPSISRQTEDLKTLEDQMREALGIDKPTPQERPEILLDSFEFQTIPSTTPPPPGIEQASETAKRQAALEKELRATLGVPTPPQPEVPKRKPIERRPLFKRQLEVMLQVRDADWREIPFHHVEYNMTAVEAEICAGKKARSFGLKVLKHIKTTAKEVEYTVGAARA